MTREEAKKKVQDEMTLSLKMAEHTISVMNLAEGLLHRKPIEKHTPDSLMEDE